MQTLFLTENVSLSMVQDGLKIKNGESTQIVSPPYIPWDLIVIQNGFGYISLAAMRILLSLRISISMLDYQGRLMGHMAPYDRRVGGLEIRQFQAASDPKKRLAIAKMIAIRGYRRRGMNPAVSSAATIPELMSMEANIAVAYWNNWKSRLDHAWPQNDFDSRVNPRYRSRKRAVTKTNAILNYSYALLQSACRTMIRRAGLVPEIGFLHQERTFSKNAGEPLVWDFEELGRAWIDEAVLEWLSKPANRTGFKREDDWAIRMKPETTRGLIEFVSGRIQNETLWHDSRDIVKRL
jgi:CRISPR/Cas system-associated endonuclease Cas1